MQRRKAAASRFGGVARGEPKPIRRAFGVARGEPKPIRRAFASPSWLRSLVHSRFRPPGFARLQGRLIRPGLTPRLRCLWPACPPQERRSAAGGGDEGRAGWRRGAVRWVAAQAGRVFGCRRHLGFAEAASRPEDPSRFLPLACEGQDGFAGVKRARPVRRRKRRPAASQKPWLSDWSL